MVERADVHHCHAVDCPTPCKPEMLMCGKHWRMVPQRAQAAVWATYRRGQCDDMRPSDAWHDAADEAIAYVAWKEGKPARLPGVFRRALGVQLMRITAREGFYV